MPSLPRTSTTGRPFLVSFASSVLILILLFLGCSGARGASLREHRLRGSEPDSPRGNGHQAPNADMLKALEYIEDLRQRAGAGYDESPGDDAEKLRAMLRLASDPVQGEEDEDEEEEEEEGREDKSEELLQAVLSTLQQSEKPPKAAPLRPGGPQQGRQPGIRPHKKLPLMFEDEEEGEGDEEGGEEGEGVGRESPFKRTSEDVEEKYTPQNLATLQSVFSELDKLSAAHKRQHDGDEEEEEEEEEQEEGNDEEDDDVFTARSVDYGEMGEDLADWAPLRDQQEEEEEEEEEERDDRHEADRGLDYFDGSDGEADEDGEEEGDEGYPVRRSKEPDDVANLVDYYLLRVLEKTEEEEQKREIEEEQKKRAERRVAQAQFRDNINPQAIYQLIQVSQKYQIPPEDLVDMLKTGETTSPDKSQKSSDPTRAGVRPPPAPPKKTHKVPEATFYSGRHPGRQESPEEELRAEEILNILGLGGSDDRAPVRKQHASPPPRPRARPAGRPGEAAPTQRRLSSGAARDDYDDSVDDDQLAAYLAAQMLARYPKSAYSGGSSSSSSSVAGRKHGGAGRSTIGSFEQAIQDYFDQVDSDQSAAEKRQSEDEERGGGTRGQASDSEAVMKLLSYLSPETEESDTDAKTVQGI